MVSEIIDELFEAQVERAPGATAVEFEDERLTYRELNQRADDVAQQLRSVGVGPDVLVALFLERSLDIVVGMLGVLKAGGAYVPLDPAHPRNRLEYMLADAKPLVVLTQTRLQSTLPPHGAHVMAIDARTPMAARSERGSAASRRRSPSDLAYVIYTSGSTGKPKGVEIEHGAVVNMLMSMHRRPGLAADDTMLAITTLTFDIAALEIFLPLMNGARVVVAAGEIVSDGLALADFIERHDVTILQATPSTLRMLLDVGWQGNPRLKILCGGEAWTADLAKPLLARCASLWNMYGPTETTVWSAVAKVEADHPILIGSPIANTRLYVLDGARQLVPVGVPGELYIGGRGLARGYLHQPDLTHERFVPDPYAPHSGARMYRTGDAVGRLPDGKLEFLGRLDHQVKILGKRIELAEIEAALLQNQNVAQAVVMAREDQAEQKRLVGYVVPKGIYNGEMQAGEIALHRRHLDSQLRETLRLSLPEYMIPTAFVILDRLPLTLNGKVDRSAFPSPDRETNERERGFTAPRTPIEHALEEVWCKILGLTNISMRDNFFELGGNSLLAVRLINMVNQKLETKLPVAAIFLTPTIEALSASTARTSKVGNDLPQIISLQAGHSGLPIYFINCGPLEYQIAQHIDSDRPIFGTEMAIRAEWRHAITAGNRTALPTIQQLGALYGDALRAHAGAAPCIIVGYSFWGKLAFEAAHAVRRAKGNVALVLLLDAYAWVGTSRGAALESFLSIWNGGGLTASLRRSWRLLWWLLQRFPSALVWWLLQRRMPRKLRSQLLLRFFGDVEHTSDEQSIVTLAPFVAKTFVPRVLDGAGLLFRTKILGEEMLPGSDLTNGWRNMFTRGLKIVSVPGDHHSFIETGNLGELARRINAALDQYDVELGQGESRSPFSV